MCSHTAPLPPPKPESDEERKAAFFSFHETASSSEFCWLMLVMRIPMLSGSFCKWCLLVLVVLIRLVMLALLVELVLLVSCHL